MQRFSLATLAGSRRRPSVTLPPIRDSLGAKKEYERELKSLLRSIAKSTKETVMPLVEREIFSQSEAITRDAVSRDFFASVRALSQQLVDAAEAMSSRILQAETRRHTRKWKASVKSALGVDLEAVVREEDIIDYLQTAVSRNVALIQGLSDDTLKSIEIASYNAVTNGRTVTGFRKELTERFAVASSRAELIAQDQISKLTSDLNQIRHLQAGVERYIWRTSEDERVRSRHRALNGKEYAYGEPTGAEQGLAPGKPIRCRCVARGIVRFEAEAV